MNETEAALHSFGGDPTAYVDFQADTPDLLPYSTLLTARSRGLGPLDAVLGVYEWQGAPLLFVADEQQVAADTNGIRRLRRLLALRGDAPYLGLLRPGCLTVYQLGLDNRSPGQVRVGSYSDDPKWRESLALLGNGRPTRVSNNKWVSDVVLRLLTTAIDSLTDQFGLDGPDAISLVGRALFTRFLADRGLLPKGWRDEENPSSADLFSSPAEAERTCAWLDKTFNGDFLPLDHAIVSKLPLEAFSNLTDIMSKAPGGQFFLQWEDDWAHLDFAHIPVGVLSQAYERFLQTHAPQQQRKEGSYYTPTAIAELMVHGAFAALRRNGSAGSAKVLDPAAGAGVFLISSFRELIAERWKEGVRPNTHELRSVLYDQIRGFDINEAALRFAALGLYLISIELDPNPEPVEKLKFPGLRGTVLRNLSAGESNSTLGSLEPEALPEHRSSYDLVIGNPPWTTGTKLADWARVLECVGSIATERVSGLEGRPPIPNEALDLPFVWYACNWARPGGQIAFALHARVLFQQGEGMPLARSALFRALDITGIVNGSELRQTKVWPGISAPFCLLFARNNPPAPGSAFRFLTPRLERHLNDSGSFRVDTSNAELVRAVDASTRPTILKTLFRGTTLDLEILDRIAAAKLETIEQFWKRRFGEEGRGLRYAGNGYQALRRSTTKPASAEHLKGLPHLVAQQLESILVDPVELPRFKSETLHRAREASIYRGPLLLVHKSPPANAGRIRTAVSDVDLVFSETYYGYSANTASDGHSLVRFLALVIGSRISLWHALMTSGEFGFEREVVEKFIVDRALVPDFDRLAEPQKAEIELLFDQVARSDTGQAWAMVDNWLAKYYNLRESDLEVINETLRYNLPFASNRAAAQRSPSSELTSRYLAVLSNELKPWATRFGSKCNCTIVPTPAVSPWKLIRVSFDDERNGNEQHRWPAIFDAANALAATEIIVVDEVHRGLWVAKLSQARHWSTSDAKLLCRRIIWEHLEILENKKAG